MSSVSIDLFQMPAVVWEGVEYDAFAACGDRMSGWIVATPHKLRGLTAAKVANAMYEKWWSPHGIPSVVTSDKGPHFAGAWWRTMCALHGVRQAYSQAYHHAANGRAEVAGEQLQKRLRKLLAEEAVCWVPALQRAVQQLHDVPGQSGLSPYQILYGRDRHMAGVPYESPKVMPDAVAFFKYQREVDAKVAKALEDLHQQRAEQCQRPQAGTATIAGWTESVVVETERADRREAGELLGWTQCGAAAGWRALVHGGGGRWQDHPRASISSDCTFEDSLSKPAKLYQYKQAVQK